MSFDPETARKIAAWFNERGRSTADRGATSRARWFYQLASLFDSTWSVPYYNLGLLEKYAGNWESSRRLNQRSAELDPEDQDSWWNLGIAATALADWKEARRAWKACGIKVPEGTDELRIALPNACVRLNPNGSAEVVWGNRLDPARIEITNIPLPESGHRFGDIVLHDGAPCGTRIAIDSEFPVFDELMLWKSSAYSTFQVNLEFPSEAALDRLMEICHARELGMEDWSTVRTLCNQCSRGNPGPHDCQQSDKDRGCVAFGFAARIEIELTHALHDWSAQFGIDDVGAVQLLLAADSEL